MKRSTKIIWLSLAAIAAIGAYTYSQLKKMMKYVVKLDNIKFKDVSMNKLDMDLFLSFKNPSELSITLTRQKYDIYIEGNYVTTLQNELPTTIGPLGESIIGLNARLNPQEVYKRLNINPVSFALDFKKLRMKVDMQLSVRVLFFSIPVWFSQEETIETWMKYAGLKK